MNFLRYTKSLELILSQISHFLNLHQRVFFEVPSSRDAYYATGSFFFNVKIH